jgi:hypothetical protein
MIEVIFVLAFISIDMVLCLRHDTIIGDDTNESNQPNR